jgi:hypothetical protein
MKTIAILETELVKNFRKKWNSPNVYARHIGTIAGEPEKNVFCIFQLEGIARKQVRMEHVIETL